MIFTADTATYDVIDGAHVAGLAIGDGSADYLMFQRSLENDCADRGIYVELNDQINSGYDLVQTCRIQRQELVVDLTEPVGGADAIRVKLSIEDKPFRRFVDGMKIIFRGKEKQLIIDA